MKSFKVPQTKLKIKVCKHFRLETVCSQTLSNPLSANPTKWSKTLKKFLGKLQTNCLSVFDHFVGLALKGLRFPKGIKRSQLQASNYIFRDDPRKFSEQFHQLGVTGECCKLPHWGFGAKTLSKCKKIAYSLTLFGIRYNRILQNFQCRQKLRSFTQDKNSNRRKVLIRKFHKKLLKVIC